jgi:hypothetical protein
VFVSASRVSKAKLLKMAKFSAGMSAFAELMGREQIALLSALRLGRWELNGFLHKIQLVASAACPDPGCLVDETHEHVLMECPRFSAERLNVKQRLQSCFGTPLFTTAVTKVGRLPIPQHSARHEPIAHTYMKHKRSQPRIKM